MCAPGRERKNRVAAAERGHTRALGLKAGADPKRDARERSLRRSATRGVVRLFNAVWRAQRGHAEGQGDARAVAASKASLLAGLDAGAGKAVAVGKAAEKAPEGKGGGTQPQRGWDVLQEDFTGLSGRAKLKDWDKAASDSDDEAPASDSESDS